MTHDWDQHHARTPHGHAHEHGHGGGDHGASMSTAELAGFLAGCATQPRRAIDLGCGTGADAVFLAEQGIDATGLDLSGTALEQARERADRHDVTVTWLQGDVLELPLEDGSMDLVLDRGCLHHLDAEQQERYATEVARVLAPGGALLVREMNQPGHHRLAVSESSLEAMVEHTPLRIRSIVRHATTVGEHAVHTMLAVLDRG